MTETAEAPTRVYQDIMTDSRRWASFRPRSGDVIVSTPSKSGTTWMQGLLALLFTGDPEVNVQPSQNAPWFDNNGNTIDEVNSRLDVQTGRRQVKTHTPLDGVPHWADVPYITVYRHPIDVHFSVRRHVANYKPEIVEEMGLDMKLFPDDPRESFHIFLEADYLDHSSLSAIVTHYKATLERESWENLLRVHYADMQRDLAAATRRVATHIDVDHSPEKMEALVGAATFDNMKRNVDRFGLVAGYDFWRKDADFFHSGTSRKWEGVLTDADLATYDSAISKVLDQDARAWLEWGDHSRRLG
ncbi:sulfotransferase domain-containing protein [Boseongicola aestuarii]|uniref:Glycolipid sulfotransferase n=1 Tax=Boseongicola aestuarii TaxID=1470561 RepID=A0A238J4U2_9RHOB|nr:sulfotransferase domain-containing protein [Boseongicola aestuarii]SMX25627.1 Glycolipid sulfotransferase [Boseongicola aestuarii]